MSESTGYLLIAVGNAVLELYQSARKFMTPNCRSSVCRLMSFSDILLTSAPRARLLLLVVLDTTLHRPVAQILCKAGRK